MMAVGDLSGQPQKIAGLSILHGLFSPQDRIPAMFGVIFHDLEFSVRQLSRLEQDRIGNADLSDIVQWSGFIKMIDGSIIQQ